MVDVGGTLMRLEFPNGERPAVDIARVVTTVGSDESCDVVLSGSGVLSRHARFERSVRGVYVCPCEDRARCLLNGRTLHQRAPLQAGDRLYLGAVECRVGPAAGASQTRPRASASAREVGPLDATRVRAVLPGLVLRGLSGPTLGHGFAVRDGMLLGRQDDCHVCIETMNVSRHHARLHVGPEGVEAEDLGSANGTFINGKRIQRSQLRPGDKLCLDEVCFALLEPAVMSAMAPRASSRRDWWLWLLAAGVLSLIAVLVFLKLRL